jgi:hypothetical protein
MCSPVSFFSSVVTLSSRPSSPCTFITEIRLSFRGFPCFLPHLLHPRHQGVGPSLLQWRAVWPHRSWARLRSLYGETQGLRTALRYVTNSKRTDQLRVHTSSCTKAFLYHSGSRLCYWSVLFLSKIFSSAMLTQSVDRLNDRGIQVGFAAG